MKRYLNIFFILISFLVISCSKESPEIVVTLDLNEEAKQKLLGTWISVYVDSSGIDITDTAGTATVTYYEDNTVNHFTTSHGGIGTDGTYFFSNEAKKLFFVHFGGGDTICYEVLKLTATEFSTNYEGMWYKVRVDYEKQ